MQKIFKFEELQCNDDAFHIFKKLQQSRKDIILNFYKNLLDINLNIIDPIKEDK